MNNTNTCKLLRPLILCMKQSMLSSYLFQDLSEKTGIDGNGKKKVPGSFDDASSNETFRGMAVLMGADNPQDEALSHLRPVLNESSSLEDACSEGNRSFCMSMIDDTHSFEEEILPSTTEANRAYATNHSGFTGNVGASLNLNDGTDHNENVSNHHSRYILSLFHSLANSLMLFHPCSVSFWLEL